MEFSAMMLAVALATPWSGKARAEYELEARVSAGVDAGLIAGDHPDQTQTQNTPSVGVSASVSDKLDTICWRDTGLQVHCETGTTPSGTSIETLSTGSTSAEGFAQVIPGIDPQYPEYNIITLKAKTASSITPTHTDIAKAGGFAQARYITRLHFVRNMACAQKAISADIIFRGKNTYSRAGSTHFQCLPGFCDSTDPQARAQIAVAGPWLERGGDIGLIASTIIELNPGDDRVKGYSSDPGIHDFIAIKASTIADIFAAGAEGLRLEVILNADTTVKGDSSEDPSFSLDEETTLIGFVFWDGAGYRRLLDLPVGAITITDDAGYRFRVLSLSEVNDIYANDPRETPCGSTDGTPDGGGDSSPPGDTGNTGENACTPAPCGAGCAPTLTLSVLGLFALRTRRGVLATTRGFASRS
jgi:hypothetical protein